MMKNNIMLKITNSENEQKALKILYIYINIYQNKNNIIIIIFDSKTE